ncbi:hypothetical protein AAFC00_000828 [Neodothiora populina]|uniref:Uncharacterized protein n=1 Tax=Neodothiora populina TaxID=2781224 RepID=A0ABR3PLU9_9PEZI
MSKAKPQANNQLSDLDIDDDPFSHFLSPVLDDDDPFDDDEFSAGINTYEDEVESKRSNFRTRIGEKWDSLIKQRQRPRTPPDEDQLPDLEMDDVDMSKSPLSSPPDLNMLEQELDGWEADRLRQRRTFGSPLQRPMLKTSRTLSGRKHSWAEPSPTLWNIDEDDEAEAVRPTERGRGRRRER